MHAGHVERPERTAVLVQRLRETGLADRCWRVPARMVGSYDLTASTSNVNDIPVWHLTSVPCSLRAC